MQNALDKTENHRQRPFWCILKISGHLKIIVPVELWVRLYTYSHTDSETHVVC